MDRCTFCFSEKGVQISLKRDFIRRDGRTFSVRQVLPTCFYRFGNGHHEHFCVQITLYMYTTGRVQITLSTTWKPLERFIQTKSRPFVIRSLSKKTKKKKELNLTKNDWILTSSENLTKKDSETSFFVKFSENIFLSGYPLNVHLFSSSLYKCTCCTNVQGLVTLAQLPVFIEGVVFKFPRTPRSALSADGIWLRQG